MRGVRLRRSDRRAGAAVGPRQGRASPLGRALSVRARRRVPGHQRRAAAHGEAPRVGPLEPVRRRRRRPVDLQLARRRSDEHPAVRRAVPGREDRQARAELPVDEDDPRRGEPGDREQQAAPRQGAVVADRRGRGDHARGRADRRGRSEVGRARDPSARQGRPALERHRDHVPLEHPVEGRRGGAAHARRAVRDVRRPAVLRAQGSERCHRIPARRAESARRARAAARAQLPGARDRRADGRAARRGVVVAARDAVRCPARGRRAADAAGD